MKTVGNMAARRRLAGKRKVIVPVIGELAHDLFNQLTVINLCGGQLAASLRGINEPAVAAHLNMLEKSAEEATRLAERLAQLMAEQRSTTRAQAAKFPSVDPPSSKVLRLF